MEDNKYIFDFLKKLGLDENSNILEIGAHMGFDTEKIRKFSPNSNLYSFEPDPRNIKILEERKIDMISNIFPIAISDKSGKVQMNISEGYIQEKTNFFYFNELPWSASNSIKKPKKLLDVFPWCKFEKQIDVECKTLDQFCEEQSIKKIDFIWMDVQGAEELVFIGGKEILKKTEYIFTKYSNDELYEDQKDLNSLLEFLPGEWKILQDYGGDVLLENIEYRKSFIEETGKWNIKNLNEHFFDEELAFAILEIINDEKIKDCLDLGCGPGDYVKFLLKKGVSCEGYDGNINTPVISGGTCKVLELTEDFFLGEKDLVLCLEVGEHIPEKYETIFIKNLNRHTGKFLILSWGIPGQGGYGHVNCKTNEYIIDKFERIGMTFLPTLSKKLRKKSKADWFKETILVFRKK
jgi:FkbM family methyltransferase